MILLIRKHIFRLLSAFFVIVLITPLSVLAEDSDGDGVDDVDDAFPNDASETVDLDGDGVGDNADAFPNDASEWADSDGDGVGDNADAFPMDSSQWADSDGDGYGDNSEGTSADACPQQYGTSTTDQFGCPDYDGDGYSDMGDAFPNDASETVDLDGDGVGDNADAFPNDAFEWADSDGDGVGDNADAFPNDPNRETDDIGSQVIYVFTGDATAMQYIALSMSAIGLMLSITLGLRRASKSKSSDKQMKSLLTMIERTQSAAELTTIGSTVDEKFLGKKIIGEHHSFLKEKISEKNSVLGVNHSNVSTINHNITKHISYNIQDSVVTGNENLSEIILPDPSSTGVVKDGFEWLEHGGNFYYRPANQPNSQWQRWQV